MVTSASFGRLSKTHLLRRLFRVIELPDARLPVVAKSPKHFLDPDISFRSEQRALHSVGSLMNIATLRDGSETKPYIFNL